MQKNSTPEQRDATINRRPSGFLWLTLDRMNKKSIDGTPVLEGRIPRRRFCTRVER